MIGTDNSPDDFFVGIGDINSTFLPKLNGLGALPGPKTPDPQLSSPPSGSSSSSPSTPPSSSPQPSAPNEITLVEVPRPPDEAAKQAEQDTLLTQNTLILEAQLEERPLAKLQEELSEKGSVNGDTDTAPPSPVLDGEQLAASAGSPTPVNEGNTPKERPPRKALLTNNDSELTRIQVVNGYLFFQR